MNIVKVALAVALAAAGLCGCAYVPAPAVMSKQAVYPLKTATQSMLLRVAQSMTFIVPERSEQDQVHCHRQMCARLTSTYATASGMACDAWGAPVGPCLRGSSGPSGRRCCCR